MTDPAFRTETWYSRQDLGFSSTEEFARYRNTQNMKKRELIEIQLPFSIWNLVTSPPVNFGSKSEW